MFIDPPLVDRRSASSRRSDARARMLAARWRPAGRHARSAWRRPGRPARGAARVPRGRLASRAVSAYGGSRTTTSNGPASAAFGPASHASASARHDPRPLAGEPGPGEVGGDDRGRALVALDEGGARGAARERLDPGRPGAREQVQEPGIAQVRLEDGEERLLDPVGDADASPRPGASSRIPRAVPAMTRPASAAGAVTRRSPARRPRRVGASRRRARR